MSRQEQMAFEEKRRIIAEANAALEKAKHEKAEFKREMEAEKK
jgi:hypothetical protein